MLDQSSSAPSLLAATRLFSELPASAVDALEGICHWRRHQAGTLVIDATQTTPHGVFVLADGEVEVCRTAEDGHIHSVARLGPPTLFGEFGVIHGEPGSASVQTIEHSVIGEIPGAVFLRLLQDHPVLSLSLLRRAVGALREIDRNLSGMHGSGGIIEGLWRRSVLKAL